MAVLKFTDPGAAHPPRFPFAPIILRERQAPWRIALRRALRDAAAGSARSTRRRVRSPRPRFVNRNHHLWHNNGTWFMHCTVYPTRCTKLRLRYSLGTRCIKTARLRRDAVFAALNSQGVLSTHGHAVASYQGACP